MTANFGPTWTGLAWASVPLIVAWGLLVVFRLGQTGPMIVATARLVGQMMLLAVVLGRIVAADSPALVLAVALLMLATAAHAVGARYPHERDRWVLRVEAFASMLLGSVMVLAVSVRLALDITPWYDPRTVLPMLGMILGNTVSAISLGAERFDSTLRLDRELVELRLSLGATARQAATPALRAAVAAGLAPILNNMSLAGIVAIPGMTTGQLLAGADVGQAIRYQILLYLAIAATVTFGLLTLLACRFRRAFTGDHQLRHDRGG